MPDARQPDCPTPLDWGSAFASLPQASPPAHGWERLSTRLDRRRHRRVPAWIGLAAAATLAAVMVWLRAPTPDSAPASTPIPSPLFSGTVADADTKPAAARDTPPGGTRVAAVAAGSTEGVAASARPPSARVEPGDPGSDAGAAADLARLYTESAQLEALLAASRDQRSGSAGAMLLADALDAQVAGIDAALATPDLAPERRESLWQARVAALRQAVGFESTQRLVAARNDPAMLLVSVD
jgi:hypothetical protein